MSRRGAIVPRGSLFVTVAYRDLETTGPLQVRMISPCRYPVLMTTSSNPDFCSCRRITSRIRIIPNRHEGLWEDRGVRVKTSTSATCENDCLHQGLLHRIHAGLVAGDVIPHPVDGLRKAVFQRYRRLPPRSWAAFELSQTSTRTSLFSGRTRCFLAGDGRVRIDLAMMVEGSTSMVTPLPRRALIVWPTAPSHSAILMNAWTVSVTKVRSRTGVSDPSLMVSEVSAWVMMGVSRRRRWRGPKCERTQCCHGKPNEQYRRLCDRVRTYLTRREVGDCPSAVDAPHRWEWTGPSRRPRLWRYGQLVHVRRPARPP